MKYKVGDKVRVKKNLVVDKKYGSESFVDLMFKHQGKKMTIVEIKYNSSYKLKEDRNDFNWTDEMLEPIEKTKSISVKNKIIEINRLPKKKYVISTKILTLQEAENQIKKWNNKSQLRHGTKVYEITDQIYEPKLKLIKI